MGVANVSLQHSLSSYSFWTIQLVRARHDDTHKQTHTQAQTYSHSFTILLTLIPLAPLGPENPLSPCKTNWLRSEKRMIIGMDNVGA